MRSALLPSLLLLGMVGCSSPAAGTARGPTCTDKLDVVYTGENASPTSMFAVGDTLYFVVPQSTGYYSDLQSFSVGGAMKTVVPGIATVSPIWNDGTSFYWVTPKGIASAPIAGGTESDGPPSIVSQGSAFAKDATNVYALVLPSTTTGTTITLVSQALAGGTAQTIGSFPTTEATPVLVDEGSELLVALNDATYLQPKAGGAATRIATPAADSLSLLFGSGSGLDPARLQGSVRSLWPSGAPPFGTTQVALASDGTIYLAGSVSDASGKTATAFAAAPRGEMASIISCPTPPANPEGYYVAGLATATSGTYAVVGAGGSPWSVIQLPR